MIMAAGEVPTAYSLQVIVPEKLVVECKQLTGKDLTLMILVCAHRPEKLGILQAGRGACSSSKVKQDSIYPYPSYCSIQTSNR